MIDWDDPAQVDLWRRVVEVIEDRRMPPPDAEPAPQADREAIVAFLDPPILAHTSFGGTPPRRLNRDEYAATIRRLCHLPAFTLPVGFPPDTERHGFDNLAEGLVLSPAHLEAYAEVARDVAEPDRNAGFRHLCDHRRGLAVSLARGSPVRRANEA